VRGRGSRLWLGGAEPLATQSQLTTVEGIRTPGMPSTTVLLLNVLLGSIGAGYLVYGRRNHHLLASLCGLLLMVVPALFSTPLPLVLAGMAVMTLPFLLRS